MPSRTVPPPSSCRRYRAPARFAVLAARRLGMRPVSVEQMVHGYLPVQDRLEAILEGAIATGDVAVIEKVLRPIERAKRRLEAIQLTPDLIRRAQTADAAEDVAESACLSDRTPERVREWLLSIRSELALLLEIEGALVRELSESAR